MFKMDKKAIGKEMLYFFATLFIILLLVLFVLISQFFHPKTGEIISKFSINNQGAVSLNAFLNTQAEVDGQKITMSDLVRIAQIDDAYKSRLKEESEKIFGSVYGKNIQFTISSISPIEVLVSPYFPGEENFITLPFPSYQKTNIFFGIGDKYLKNG